MRHPLFLLACAAASLAACAKPAPVGTVIVVNPGEPLSAARDRARSALAKGELPVTVHLAAGVHTLDAPLILTEEDSGTEAQPVVWEGESGTVVSGGRVLADWTDDGGDVVSTPLPQLRVDEFWVGGFRASNSVFPMRGWASPVKCDQTPAKTEVNIGKTLLDERIVFCDPSVTNTLAGVAPEDLPSMTMCARWKWSYATRRNLKLEANGSVVGATAQRAWAPWAHWGRELRVTFTNVRLAFANPGDWFVDLPAGRLRYRLCPWETAANFRAVVPAGPSTLVSLDGVHDIVFKGIAFAYTAAPERQEYNGQAAAGNDAAIEARGLVRGRFERCAVMHTGNYGMRFRDGCVSNVVAACRLEDLGAGGIYFGSGANALPNGIKERRAVVDNSDPRGNRFNRVEDCRILHGGQVNPEGVGILLTNASDCTVTHNEIDDFFYTGVSVGWCWGYSGSVSQRNTVSFNRITNLGKGWMDDLAGVYTLGTSFGTCVSNNVIAHVRSVDYGGWGLYTDEGSEGIVMENNLVLDTDDGSFHQHYGVGCLVRNNVMVGNRRMCAVRISNNMPGMKVPSTIGFVNNIVVTGGNGPRFVNEQALAIDGVWAGNIWRNTRGKDDFDGRGMDAEAFFATRRDVCGRFADPGLTIDGDRGFALSEDSPARALGFRPWDARLSGVRPGR